MKVVYIYKRIPHHAVHSGYNRLADYVLSSRLSLTLSRLIEKALNILPEEQLKKWTWVGGWYRNESLAKEIQVALNMPFRRAIYHYLYGEDEFHWGGGIPYRFGSRIVVSYHQPPSVFDEVFKDKSFIAKADALVACGTNQVEYLENITGRKNVFFVPHGIDIDFYTPGKKLGKKMRFNTVSVGWYLRDVEMIKRVIKKANKLSLNVDFNIVTFPQYFDYYKDLQNVNLFSGISDEELRTIYQDADAVLLPMKDCTANNGILEGMACGLPVLTTNNGGMRDYVDESCGYLAKPGDDQFLSNALLELMNDSEKKEEMGKAARKKALEFDWKRVAVRMMDVYRQIT